MNCFRNIELGNTSMLSDLFNKNTNKIWWKHLKKKYLPKSI